jgi:hypothetical protein
MIKVYYMHGWKHDNENLYNEYKVIKQFKKKTLTLEHAINRAPEDKHQAFHDS